MKKLFKSIAAALVMGLMIIPNPGTALAAQTPVEAGYIEIAPTNSLLLYHVTARPNIPFLTDSAMFGNAVRVWYRNDSTVWTYVAVIAPNGATLGRFSVAPGAQGIGYITLAGNHNRVLNLSITTVNGTAPRGAVSVRQLAV